MSILVNPFQIFKHPKFKEIRGLLIDGNPWFVGKDVAVALGYKKTENAIAMHVDDEDKTTTLIQGTGSNYKSKAVIINESGLYSLIFASKMPDAKEFRRWVTNEVLPSIRKTGSYSLDAQTAQLIPAAIVEKSAARRAAQLVSACVYVVLLQNTDGEFVKIGHSGKIRNRVTAVKRQTKSTTKDLYVTPFMPRKAARLLEWLIQEKFSSRCVKGEFFSVDFEKVCAAVDMFTKVVLIMPLDEDFEKLKSQVKLLTDAVEDFATLDYRADLLAGENIFCRTIE